MNFHQNPSILTNVFKLQISPMRRPSKSDSPKCPKYQNVPYIRNFWHTGKPWERFQCWFRIIYFLTVPDDHTVTHSPRTNTLLVGMGISPPLQHCWLVERWRQISPGKEYVPGLLDNWYFSKSDILISTLVVVQLQSNKRQRNYK